MPPTHNAMMTSIRLLVCQRAQEPLPRSALAGSGKRAAGVVAAIPAAKDSAPCRPAALLMPAGSHGDAALGGFPDINRSILTPFATVRCCVICRGSLKLGGTLVTFPNRR